jgi:hypothetical protein
MSRTIAVVGEITPQLVEHALIAEPAPEQVVGIAASLAWCSVKPAAEDG